MIDSLQRRISLCIATTLLLGSLCGLPSACGAEESVFRDIKMTPDRNPVSEASGALRADASEIADLLNISPIVDRLRALKQIPATEATHRTRAVETMRLMCLWKLFIASQEVRKVVAQIDYDLAISNASLDELTAKKYSLINNLNQVNFMQQGILGIVKNSISFPGKAFNPVVAQELAITYFGTGTAISTANFFIVPHLFRKRIDGKPNMLAHIFDANYRPDDAQQSYLWKFFSSPIPGSTNGLTRRQILIKHWEAFAGLRSESEKNVSALAAMNDGEKVYYENIRVLNQRIDLLQDMKSHIEEFDASLFEVHKAITMN